MRSGTHSRSLYTSGPCRFRDRGEGRARCQARSGELPTILRTEAALCGRKRAAALLALNPRARTRDLGTTVAPDRAICKYPPVRGIARTIRESHLRSLPRFLVSLPIFRTATNLRVPCAETCIFHVRCIRKLRRALKNIKFNSEKQQTFFHIKLNIK